MSTIEDRIDEVYDLQQLLKLKPLKECVDPKDKEPLKTLKQIGKGEYGTVYEVEKAQGLIKRISTYNSPHFALKISLLKKRDIANLATERYPLPFLGELSSGSSEVFTYRACNILVDAEITENLPMYVDYQVCTKLNELALVVEFAPYGDLQSFITRNPKLYKKEIASQLFFQVTFGLSALSYHFGITHNDLHFNNVLVYKRQKQIPGARTYYQIGKYIFALPQLEYFFVPTDFGFVRQTKLKTLVKMSDLDRLMGITEWFEEDGVILPRDGVLKTEQMKTVLLKAMIGPEKKKGLSEKVLLDMFGDLLVKKVPSAEELKATGSKFFNLTESGNRKPLLIPSPMIENVIDLK